MSLHIDVNWQRGEFRLHCNRTLPTEGVTALFGRSGCGKTSLLRVIAGLERVNGARVSFKDQVWQQDAHFLPAERRRIGLVFQEPSLLPHLSVKGNLLYGWQRTPEAQRRLQLDEVVQMLAIQDLLARSVDQLSGGQRQRVALGRALLASPQLLLLDEPLAALDTEAKREIMPFLSRLSRDAGVPMVLITHAPDEVQRLADTVVFMRSGTIDDVCPLQQAVTRAESPLFTDEGPFSVLSGVLGEPDEHGLCIFGAGESKLYVQAEGLPTDTARQGAATRIRILARDVSVALDDPVRISIQNHLPVTIISVQESAGQGMLLNTQLADGQTLLIEITQRAFGQLGLEPGQRVWALIKSVALFT